MTRAQHVALVVFGILFLNIGAMAAEANPIQLILDSARYEASGSKVVLRIRAKNGSSDPVSLLKPVPSLIDKHYAQSGVSFVGVGGRPYKLSVVQTGKCSGAVDRVLRNQAQAALITKRHMVFLAPNSEMDLGSVEVDVDGVVFCHEAKSSVQLTYEPAFTLPTPDAGTKIDAYIKARTMNPDAIRGLLPPDAKFIAEMGFLPENANLFSGAQEEPPSIERYVASVKLMEASSKNKIVSNTVAVKSSSDKGKASEEPAPATPKTKAKSVKK